MLTKQKAVFWLVILGTTLACTVLVLAVGRTKKPKAARVDERASAQLNLVRGPMQNIRFTLDSSGIYPQKLHAKPGNVVIAVEDRTGNSLGLVVQCQTDSLTVAVGQVTVLDRLRGRAQFSLVAGRYVISDASRPSNRAELLVEP